MEIKLFDAELKVMDVLWREGDATAKHISDVLKEEIGWNINTTYTLIRRWKRSRTGGGDPGADRQSVRRQRRQAICGPA